MLSPREICTFPIKVAFWLKARSVFLHFLKIFIYNSIVLTTAVFPKAFLTCRSQHHHIVLYLSAEILQVLLLQKYPLKVLIDDHTPSEIDAAFEIALKLLQK